MKKMRKFLSVMLASVMAVGMSVTSFAAFSSADAPASSTASPQITNVAKETTAMTAYSVITASDNGKGVVTYKLDDWAAEALAGKTFTIDSKSVTLVTKDASKSPVVYTVDMDNLIKGLGGFVGVLNGQKKPNNTTAKTDKNEILAAIASGDRTQTSGQYKPTSITAATGLTTTPPAAALQTATFTDLKVGYYYVEATDNENVYNPMGIAVGLVSDNNGKFTEVYAQGAVAKYTTVPLVKKQTNGDGITDVSGDYQVGDEVTYEITTHIPNYDLNKFTNPVFTLSDVLDLGLDPVKSITVKVGDAANKTWTLSETWTVSNGAFTGIVKDPNITATVGDAKDTANKKIGSKFEIQFGNAIKNTPATYLDKDVVVTYTSVLNKNALTGFDPNVNTAALKYSTTPTTTKDIEKKTYSYSFAIDGGVFGNWKENGWEVKKTGKGTYSKTTTDYIESDNAALAGAEFTIYVADTNGTDKVKYSGSDVAVRKLNPSTHATKPELKGANPYTTTADGRITFEGLDANTDYYITETKAPSGYSLNTTVVKFKFIPTYDSTTGKLASYKVNIDGTDKFEYKADDAGTPTAVTVNQGTIVKDASTGGIDVSKSDLDGTTEIKNTQLTSLPSTGGIGTTIFTIGGIIVMVAAAGLYLVSRRRSVENR